jgi:hypothetical protein
MWRASPCPGPALREQDWGARLAQWRRALCREEARLNRRATVGQPPGETSPARGGHGSTGPGATGRVCFRRGRTRRRSRRQRTELSGALSTLTLDRRWPTSSTCRVQRPARVARPWGSSCGASATAPASATSLLGRSPVPTNVLCASLYASAAPASANHAQHFSRSSSAAPMKPTANERQRRVREAAGGVRPEPREAAPAAQ